MDLEEFASPEELRRLLSSFLVVLGAIIIAALFAFIVVPGLRGANRQSEGPLVTAPRGSSGWLDPTEYPPMKGYDIPPLDPRKVMLPGPEMLERGRTLYAKNCAACHGETGRGDGPGAAGLKPSPRDLTRSAGWKNGTGIAPLYKTLSEGLDGTPMASYDTLKPKDRMSLVHSVRALFAFAPPAEDKAALDALGKSLARSGGTVPDRIPVSMAVAKLSEEAPRIRLPRGLRPAVLEDVVAQAVESRSAAARTLAAFPAWKRGGEALAKAVAPGVPGNGFSVSLLTFRSSQWRELHRALASGRRER